jgi:serine/threonine-protein kinase
MLPDPLRRALSSVGAFLAADPELSDSIRAFWRHGGRDAATTAPAVPPLAPPAEIPPELRKDLALLGDQLPACTLAAEDLEALCLALGEPAGEVILAWCGGVTWRRDVALARLLETAAKKTRLRPRVAEIARGRVVEGPLVDALACAPLLGNGTDLALPENAEARARLEILIWEAGASAREVPALGRWIWSSSDTFDAMIKQPAHGALRGRVLAARCLEISVGGMAAHMTDPALVGRTLQVLQPLLLHPEPLVWVHAARALGRLTGALEQMEGTLLDWSQGESKVLRQRATTALASLPAERLTFLGGQLIAILESRDEADWVLAAVAAATPYLFFERRAIWDRLAKRVLAGDGGAVAARALARGLATVRRRGEPNADVEAAMRALREIARFTVPASLDDARRWIEVTAATDVIDGAERDPLDLELGLENLVRIAAQYDDEEADARAARFAASIAPTFQEARKIALRPGRMRHRAAAINALESCARALALRLWGPLLATRPGIDPGRAGLDTPAVPAALVEDREPELTETWKTLASAPAEILDLVAESRRSEGGGDPQGDLALEVLAIRLGGYALDACGADAELGPGRGPTAHDTCLWLRKLEGLSGGTRELPAPLKFALSTLFWRLVDTTRGTALGEVDDVRWLGPFAAWWALVIDRPAMLLQLATALPMMAEGALAKCCEKAEELRAAVSSGNDVASWDWVADTLLESLHADDTELAHALSALAGTLAKFGNASGQRAELESQCLELVLAGDRLNGALADPVKALHPATKQSAEDSLSRAATENAPRVAALVARAIRAREPSMLDVWFASRVPVVSLLLEGAVQGAIRRTPPPPPKPKREEPKIIHGYELITPLGEGGVGTVWLVRKPGADRYFVLKIPKADALAMATETEREGILASFVEEANALAGLYHPNVANIIDRGVSDGVPFLVLEYLIGADLKAYSWAHPMSLFELRQVVLDSCAGLAALHSAGLVHRDIKPANLWLRLPLAGGEKFDPVKHRDPARTQPLSTVVIDFGMVRAIRVAPGSNGRFVAGTPGYIAPEQVLDPVELDPRADVYSLAAAIYNCTTRRAFFDDVESPRDRLIAHMRRDPFDDPERLKPFPSAMAKLLRAATAKNPADRPWPMELGRAFAAAL